MQETGSLFPPCRSKGLNSDPPARSALPCGSLCWLVFNSVRNCQSVFQRSIFSILTTVKRKGISDFFQGLNVQGLAEGILSCSRLVLINLPVGWTLPPCQELLPNLAIYKRRPLSTPALTLIVDFQSPA